MDAHVLDAGETRVSTLTGSSPVPAPGWIGRPPAHNVRIFPTGGVLSKSNTTGRLGALGLTCVGRSLGICSVCSLGVVLAWEQAFLFIVDVMVRVLVVVLIVIVAVPPRPMGMTVSTEYDKTNKIGAQAGAANNKNELRAVDLGRIDESREGFEDDGDAEGDEEDGVEEGTQNLGAHPLSCG